MLCRILDGVFEDKRIATTMLFAWLCTVIIVFKQLGMFDSTYMSFGPSSKTVFMTVVLDTWYRWGLVAWFTFINTCMNDFFSDAISPWLLNTVIDHKAKYLNYPKGVCLLISQVWSVYCAVMGVLGLMVALSQIDFVLIRLAADLTVNTYTNLKFMQHKVYDRNKYYNLEGDRGSRELQTFSITEDELEDCG
jgi:hypothetical protein